MPAPIWDNLESIQVEDAALEDMMQIVPVSTPPRVTYGGEDDLWGEDWIRSASRSIFDGVPAIPVGKGMRARRKWWLIGFLVAATLSWIPFGLGYACYHNGFHWRAFQDDCNRCYCSSVVGADCTLMLCDRLPAREPPCKHVVDKLTGKSSCQPCRLGDERAYDETGADTGVDVCCEGLRVFSPPLDGKPGAGVPICSSCRPTGVSCNSNDDCCHEQDRCDNFICTTDPGWRLGP